MIEIGPFHSTSSPFIFEGTFFVGRLVEIKKFYSGGHPLTGLSFFGLRGFHTGGFTFRFFLMRPSMVIEAQYPADIVL